jgi:hypothetical protein
VTMPIKSVAPTTSRRQCGAFQQGTSRQGSAETRIVLGRYAEFARHFSKRSSVISPTPMQSQQVSASRPASLISPDPLHDPHVIMAQPSWTDSSAQRKTPGSSRPGGFLVSLVVTRHTIRTSPLEARTFFTRMLFCCAKMVMSVVTLFKFPMTSWRMPLVRDLRDLSTRFSLIATRLFDVNNPHVS